MPHGATMHVGSPRKPPRGEGWAQRRFEVLKRDKFRCQDCGAKRRKASPKGRIAAVVLHVHHKKPFRCFKSDRQANRMSNLITLCGPCHAKAERLARANKAFVTHPDYVAPASFHGRSWGKARQAALARDNRTCQRPGCAAHIDVLLGKGPPKLHVHHKVPSVVLQYLLYDGTEKSLSVAQVSANALENLITLCADCHRAQENLTKTAYPRLNPQKLSHAIFAPVNGLWNQRLDDYGHLSRTSGNCHYNESIERLLCEKYAQILQKHRLAEEAIVKQFFPNSFCVVDLEALRAYNKKKNIARKQAMDYGLIYAEWCEPHMQTAWVTDGYVCGVRLQPTPINRLLKA